jgi:fatty-acyl-CoA synthase
MKDYFDNPDATSAALDSDGWLHTGDLGSLDAQGYCRVGIPDHEWGEVLVAFVQLKPECAANEQEFIEFCRAKLASYKVPRIWEFVEQFPQTASGKIQKFVLRERYIAEKALK